ncbi:MAG: serine/threonine protein kinase [Deltaproteobacteria bacterium]|nr:serine/threonine protein kinase [Kofleriaceae bacterium]
MERALRARTQTLQGAVTQWASGDLSQPLAGDARGPDEFGAVLEQLRVALAGHVTELERRHREIQVLVDDLRAQLIQKTEQLGRHIPASAGASPRVIGDQYELGASLGVGGMGHVHHARRLSDGRRVALKLMNQPKHAVFYARFVREARLLAEVHHPGVIRILDVGLHEGQPYLVTELIEGTNLAAETEPWGLDRALPVLAAIADGLAAIHAHGIVHRDIKLANVVVGRTTSGEALTKILDFGIARDASDPELPAAPPPAEPADGFTRVVPLGRGTPLPEGASEPLTADGAMVGTLRYIAPEAQLAAPLTTAADIFSFGVLAVKLLTGEFPWSVPLVSLLRRGEPPTPPSIDASLPGWLRQLLVRCLSIDPLARPTAVELRDACRAHEHSEGSSDAGRGNLSPAR